LFRCCSDIGWIGWIFTSVKRFSFCCMADNLHLFVCCS
jgi:hypothetical protein